MAEVHPFNFIDLFVKEAKKSTYTSTPHAHYESFFFL